MLEPAVFDLAAIRAGLPALHAQIYLNSGTVGPLPAVVAQAMRDAVSEDELRGRASGRRFAKIHALLADCRERLGVLVGVSGHEIALTSGTTEGLAIALDRLDWLPGERIVTSDLEHPDVIALLEALKGRRGVDIVTVAMAGLDDAAAVEAFAQVLAPGAKLALLSHVAFGSGRVLPIKAIAAAAHAVGAQVVVDGAQAVGAIVVDVPALGADAYAFPGQKWLMGPEGSGALVLRRSGVDASVWERGTAPKAIWAGLQAALVWRAELGREAALAARIARVREDLRTVLAAHAHVTVITPPDGAGLLTFRLDGADGPHALQRLSARRIAARDIPGTDWVRLSAGIFVSAADVAAVGAALAHGEVAA
ncbi:MAG TPA: aminotransferase class V-fold PLP-dependent enzyme [Novosphingobium sp.]|nr:aminotransferase class V-fold PLP-dependent enzyme [Novosphingobium sp.]